MEPAHVPGFRYLVRDARARCVQATPRSKVSAMSHHARALAVSLRESLERQPAGEVLQALARSSADAWAASRSADSVQLLLVRERRAERTLVEAAAAVDAFAAERAGL